MADSHNVLDEIDINRDGVVTKSELRYYLYKMNKKSHHSVKNDAIKGMIRGFLMGFILQDLEGGIALGITLGVLNPLLSFINL